MELLEIIQKLELIVLHFLKFISKF